MSGLNVDNFNLFAKKPSTKAAPRPVAITSEEVIEKEIKNFDSETKNASPIVESSNIEQKEIIPTINAVEIERFDDVKPVVLSSSSTNTVKHIEKSKEQTTLRKFETFATPTFRIPEEHDFELKRIEQTIMRNRKKGQVIEGRERITSNTVVRALLANFMERVGDMDLTNIDNEEMLKERMEKIFKQKYSKRA